MTALIYDRKANICRGYDEASHPDGGTWGQITLRSLCETLEKFGGIPPGHRVTHLVIEDTISYRVEPRGGK